MKRSKSQWLKDTLQQLDDSLKQRALKAVLHDDRIKRALPNTPSHSTKSTPLRGTQSTPSQGTIGININKTRSVSSPLIARIDRLPESLRIQRQRLMEKAARSASLECPESPTTVFPPNSKFDKKRIGLCLNTMLIETAPDRPAPLALRSTNSFYSSGTLTRGMRNPIANSALELHASPKSDQTSTRYLTPGEEYLSTPTSPRARYIFTPTQSRSPLLPSLDALFHTIEETVEDDVFGIPETLTRNKRSTSHSRIEHRSSSVYSQHGSNRLSDLDWQTTSSEEEDNDLEKSLQISSNRSSIGRASQIYREYENLIPATREFHNSNSAFDEEEAFKANNRHAHCNSQCYALYELDPEDEPEEDPEYREKLQALLESLSTHEDSSEEESILESASESSGQGPRTRYTYTNVLSPSTPAFTSRRERAIAETLAQLNGTPM